jgi:glycosyltransferase involved in cell wall biosynthesis
MTARPSLPPLAPDAYRVSVVLPVYSEVDSVRAIVHWLRDHLGGRLEEILLVLSPRSQEASRKVCEEMAADPRVRLHVQVNNPGLGHAVREGYALTRGNLVLNMDSDGEMEIETVPRMLVALEQRQLDVVVAARWLPGGGFTGYSPFKKILNWGFQQLFRWLFWTRLHDLTYGFKLMRGELARGIRWEGTLHEIACETTLKPVRAGVRVGEVPTRWTARVQGTSKNTFWRNFRYVAMAWRILVRGVTWEQPAG